MRKMNSLRVVTRLGKRAALAGLVLATTALAQPEQWLEYHTSADGRAYHQMELTTNPPPGVALPKLNASPYFARWSTPMDPSGCRWLCLDRTRKSGPYFPPAPVVFKGEDGPITYHLVFRFYQYEKNPAQLLASSAGWYEGVVNFDGAKKRIQLIDGNVNGTFNDVAPDPYDSDRVQVEGDKTGERFLGKMLEVDGKFYRIEAARDGAFVKVQKAENVTLGQVRVPENISEFAAFGGNGHFVRKPVNGEFTLPTGNYRIFHWTINRKDEKGAAWTLSGYNFPKTAGFEVTADKTAVLEIGEPVQAVLKAAENTDRQVAFSLSFEGRQKESIEMLRDGQRPRGPKLMLANTDGTLCYTNTFEFG